ncbi:unnamed protein product [Symbiodinium sp. CCMP2592]|nr:unnamed protein product [Symbiodinium sp. CCMP2592]
MFGEELHKTLESEQVDMTMVPRVPNPSTLAFVSKPPGADVRYAFFKDNAADRTLTARTVGNALAARSFGAVHVSMGAITLEDASMEQAFREAFKRVHAAGGFTAFDPNLRGPMIKGSAAPITNDNGNRGHTGDACLSAVVAMVDFPHCVQECNFKVEEPCGNYIVCQLACVRCGVT